MEGWRRPGGAVGALMLVWGCSAAAPDAAPPAREDPGAGALLEVNGTKLFVYQEGSGQPMILVHGGPLLDHGYLVRPFRPLTDEYELVFYDQRLSGRSAGVVDSSSVSLSTFVQDIESLREHLGFPRVHLLGHSWGGLLAMEYALAHPERLISLTLVSPIAPTSTLWQAETAENAAAITSADTSGMGALRTSEAMKQGDPEVIEALLRLTFRSQFDDPTSADALHFEIPADYTARSRQLNRMAADLASYDLLEGLRSLDVPTLVLYGDAEVGVGLGGAALADAIPDVTFQLVPGAGHFSFMERPVGFQSAHRAFLRRVRGY